MSTTLRPALPEDLPDHPLAITIPEATRAHVALRALIRRAIPMLRHPEAYSPAAHRQLAETLTRALNPAASRIGLLPESIPPPSDADAPLEYEPGCEDGEDLL